MTQNKNGKVYAPEEVSIFYELKQETIGYLSGVWFNVFERSVIDFQVKVVTSDLEEITLPKIYVDIFCFCDTNFDQGGNIILGKFDLNTDRPFQYVKLSLLHLENKIKFYQAECAISGYSIGDDGSWELAGAVLEN